MAYNLLCKCAKNLCKQAVLVHFIIEIVVTCFLEHSVLMSRTIYLFILVII